MKKRKIILQWLLVIIAIFSFRAYQQRNLNSGIVPSFNSKTLNGVIVSSHSNETTLIHFWATWCSICQLENDNIQTISRDYRVLNIAMQSGSDTDLKAYTQEHNMKIDNIINDNSGSLSKLLGVKATPTNFFISKDNQIKFSEIGYVSTLGYRLRLWWTSL
ncbi:thioredoxin, putative [Candidatus Ruthia magnifica str. Cm (Calyptogena magnifica)]|uniref:Thioredoxin, putative n=1 Tax=Ruthia magnifica subsp. Calyptogena magnifica TaxID=413404 RepID=A1AWW5_RUTMC|nr:redoxin domain-containing protein [Candidatus Ruthturnera calyptogenae]ABL02422.1 thioredoxin, putative [Candidatus Ruthia magnifica str. Cm (Calyptogena magnifica)]